MSKNKVMMLIFVASESFFFLALIISYIYYSQPDGTLSDTAKYLDITKTSVFTFSLLSRDDLDKLVTFLSALKGMEENQ